MKWKFYYDNVSKLYKSYRHYSPYDSDDGYVNAIKRRRNSYIKPGIHSVSNVHAFVSPAPLKVA